MRGLEIQQKILTVGIGVIKLPQCSWIETCKYLMIVDRYYSQIRYGQSHSLATLLKRTQLQMFSCEFVNILRLTLNSTSKNDC